MDRITFEEMPGAIAELLGKVDALEQRIIDLKSIPEEMLTYKQACEFLQVSRAALDSAGVPYSRIGAQRRYRLKDLIEFGRTDKAAAVREKCRQLKRKHKDIPGGTMP